jgi:hypothetical protein
MFENLLRSPSGVSRINECGHHHGGIDDDAQRRSASLLLRIASTGTPLPRRPLPASNLLQPGANGRTRCHTPQLRVQKFLRGFTLECRTRRQFVPNPRQETAEVGEGDGGG